MPLPERAVEVLTPVGPHAPATYWRRRALLLAPIMALFLILATCMATANGDSDDKAQSVKRTSDGKPLPKIQDGSKEHPFYPVKEDQAAAVPAAAAPAAAPAPAPQPAPAVPPSPAGPAACADTDVAVTISTEHGKYPTGSRIKVKLAIKNTTDHECRRDIGAGQQEVFAQLNGQRIWSSDDCSTNKDAAEYTFKAGESKAYWVVWPGMTSAPGCPAASKATAGQYQIQGRVGSANSTPINVTLQ